MLAATIICGATYQKNAAAAAPFLLPVIWVIVAYNIGDTGLVKHSRTYCKQDGGFDHALIERWPKKSYAICKDKVGEPWLGKTIYLRERGVWGTPIAKLKQY